MKRIVAILSIFIVSLIFTQQIFAQQRHVCFAVIDENGDTIPLYELKEVRIAGKLFTEKELRRNKKLIRNVKKTLPYAKKARNKLLFYDKKMVSMSESQRKAYMKQAEKEIEKEFGAELKKLTFSQGNVLIKLIDRETGNTSFELVRELRGKFRAFFYQTFAKIFGYDLKAKFDPIHNSKDKMIDRIARAVEMGKL